MRNESNMLTRTNELSVREFGRRVIAQKKPEEVIIGTGMAWEKPGKDRNYVIQCH